MNYSHKPALFCLILLAANIHAMAQKLTGNSTLSRFGLGTPLYETFVRNMGMGGTGAGQFSTDHINLINPALLANNRLTNLEFAGFFEHKRIANTSQAPYGNYAGGPNYLAFSFPTGNKSTLAFGARPTHSVNYQIRDANLLGIGPDTFRANYRGSGTVNKAFVAYGRNLYRGLNAGIEAAFLIGNIEKNVFLSPESSGQRVGFQQDRLYSIKSFSFTPGISWQHRLSKENETFYCIGLTGQINSRLHYRYTDVVYNRLTGTFDSRILYPDTLAENKPTSSGLAQSIRLGMSYFKPGIFTWAMDVTLLQAHGNMGLLYSSPAHQGYEINTGFEYSKGTAKSASYANIIRYRVGLAHRREPYTTSNGDMLYDSRLSLGISFPIVRSEAKFTRPFISLAFLAGRRGTLANGPNKEWYVGTVLGFTLNDSMWFRRYRID